MALAVDIIIQGHGPTVADIKSSRFRCLKRSLISFPFAFRFRLTISCIAAVAVSFFKKRIQLGANIEGGKVVFNKYTQLQTLQLNS